MFNPNMEVSVGHIIRASLVLTNSYVAGTVISMDRENTLDLEVNFTIGSLTSLDLKIEVSNDAGTTYAQEISKTLSGGETTVRLHNYTFEATGIYAVQIRPIRSKLIKVSVLGAGTVTNSLATIKAHKSWS